ncbi:MAG: type IV secretion system DNA-binding domain-containing protein [Cyanobacteria bacterium P01_F01_bin.143]
MFYQVKKTIHLSLVAIALAITVTLLWHFWVTPIVLSGSFISRLAGVTCLFTGLTFFLKSHFAQSERITKGTTLVTPGKFNRLIKGDGVGIPFIANSWFWWTKNSSSLLKIRSSDEQQHLLISGDTGTGKSALQHSLMLQVRERGESAIIYDPSVEFWKYHGEEEDIILHPYHRDCPCWNITQEISSPLDAAALAKSFIPDKVEGRVEFWDIAPRKLLAFLFWRLKKENLGITDLVKWLSDGELINDMVEGTELESLIDRNAHGQRAGVLASLNLIADSLKLLPPNDQNRPLFSFSEWVCLKKGWIFIATRGAGEREGLRPVISAMLDVASSKLMNNKSNSSTWLFLDELPSLQKLPSLKTGLHEGRKYNCRYVLGFQGRSQLESLYGRDAEALMSAPSTRVFLRSNEFAAAEWAARNIGKPEIHREAESYSSTLLSQGRDSISTRTEVRSDYLVLPNEIQNLQKLSGYLRYDRYATFFRFPYPKLSRRNEF